jgi:RimJ/RimL family protein N-acetyltransferase
MHQATRSPIGPVELRVDELLLRPWRKDDVDAVWKACQDPDIQRWTTVPSPYTRDDAELWIGGSAERWASAEPTFACVDAGTGALLASFGLHDGGDEGGPMVGYWVAGMARGRGIATRGVRRIVEWALKDLQVPRVRWAAYVGNYTSREVAERAGFVLEGTLRQGLVQRGERRDAWIGSMVAADLARVPRKRERVAGWPLLPIELRTERLLLRAFRDDDAQSLLDYARDPEVMAWDREDTPDIEAALRRARNRRDWASGELAAWAIATPDDSDVLGGIVLADVDADSLSAEVGYGLLAHARGHGHGAEALRAVSDWAFSSTALERITLGHAVENAASCSVAKAAGYVLEGTMRRSTRFGDGELHDEHLHARLRGDT